MDLNAARQKLPELAGLSDESALNVIQATYYPDMDRGDLAKRLGVTIAPPPVPERSTLRAVGDVGLSLGQGAAGAFKALTDLGGADNTASRGLASMSKFLGNQKSEQSQAILQNSMERIKTAEESGSTWEEAKAYLGMVWDQPAEMIAQGAGSFATLGIGKLAQMAKLASAAKASGVSKDVFLASEAGKRAIAEASTVGFRTNIGVGTGMGVGAVKGSQFEQTYNNAKQQGMDEEEAQALATQAQEYGGAGTMQQVLGAGLGALATATGPIERMVVGRGGAADAGGILARTGKGFAVEGSTEGLQGAQERFAGNDAAVDAGVLAPENRMRGVVGSFAQEGVIGGVLGGGIGAMQSRADPALPPVPPPAGPPPGPMTRALGAGAPFVPPPSLTGNTPATLRAGQMGGLEGRPDPLRQMDQPPEDSDPFAGTSAFPAPPMAERGPAAETPDPLADAQVFGAPPAESRGPAAEIEDPFSNAQPLGEPAALGSMSDDDLRGFLRNAQDKTIRKTVSEEIARRKRETAPEMDPIQPTDILNPSGNPFKTEFAATRAAKKTPGEVVPVAGGFVIRPTQESPLAQDQVPNEAPAAQADPAGDEAVAADAPVQDSAPAALRTPDNFTGTATGSMGAMTSATAGPGFNARNTPNVQVAPKPAAQAETPRVETPAEAGGDAATAPAVPGAGRGGDAQADGVTSSADSIAASINASIAETGLKNNLRMYAKNVSKGYMTQEEANRRTEADKKSWSDQKTSDRTRRMAQAIADKDASALVGFWAKEGQGTFGVEGSMAAFKKLTGINLQRLNSVERAKAIYGWAGWAEGQVRADTEQRKQRKAQDLAAYEAEQAKKDAAGTERVAEATSLRIKGKDGETTVKAYIDGLIQQGYTEIAATKVGAIKRVLLAKPGDGRGYPMSKGILADYAKVAAARFSADLSKTQPEANTSAQPEGATNEVPNESTSQSTQQEASAQEEPVLSGEPVAPTRRETAIERRNRLIAEREQKGETAAKPTKVGKAKQAAIDAEQARADYFTPGNIVRGYSGFDEVLSYAATGSGNFSVRVHEVKKAGDQWHRVGRPQDARQHSTQPEPRQLAAGPEARLPYQAAADVIYTSPRYDGQPHSNAVDRGVAPAAAPAAAPVEQEARAEAKPVLSGQTVAPAPDALADEKQAAIDQMMAAAGDLAALLGKNFRSNITPEQEQAMLPIVIRLFDGAMKLGYVKFKQAARYVREFLAENISQEAADAIPIDTLQGAYIATARRHADKDVTPKAEVVGVESIEELAETPAPQESAVGWYTATNNNTDRPAYTYTPKNTASWATVKNPSNGVYEITYRQGQTETSTEEITAKSLTQLKFHVQAKVDKLAGVATHKDPGEPAEPVTKGVVNDAMKTAAKNEGEKPSDMRKWLLGEIDKALLKAPDRPDYDEVTKTMSEKDAISMFTGNGLFGKQAHTGLVSFAVPGDGTFKVRNSMRGLLEFRKNVSSSLGFKDAGQRRVGPAKGDGVQDGSGGQMAAVTNMIEEMDFEAARDYAEAVGLSLDDVKVPRGEARVAWEQYRKDGTMPRQPNTTPVPPPKTAAQLDEEKRAAQEAKDKEPSDTGWSMAGTGYAGKRYTGRNITLPDGRKVVARIYENAGVYEEAEVRVDGARKFEATDRNNAQGKADAFIKTLTQEVPEVDYKGFTRTSKGNDSFELADSNMRVTVQPTSRGKFQASVGSAKSGPNLQGEQAAVDWADAYRAESVRAQGGSGKPKSKVTPQVASDRQAEGFIQIAADSVKTLRAVDVDRVLTETPVHFVLSVAGYIKKNRKDLGDAVFDFLADEDSAPAPKWATPEKLSPKQFDNWIRERATVQTEQFRGERNHGGGDEGVGYIHLSGRIEDSKLNWAGSAMGAKDNRDSRLIYRTDDNTIVWYDDDTQRVFEVAKSDPRIQITRPEPTAKTAANPQELTINVDGAAYTVTFDEPLATISDQAFKDNLDEYGTPGNAKAEFRKMRAAVAVTAPAVPTTPTAPVADTPKQTQAEAKALMEWVSLGQTNNVKTHVLTWYESKADKDANRGRYNLTTITKGDRSETAWTVDGDDQTFGALALAKKKAEQIGMAKVVADGWVEADAAPAQPQAAAPKAEAPKEKVEDFGEKLPPARRAMAAQLGEELADEKVSTMPLSQIWPTAQNEAIEETFPAAVAHVMREAIPAKPRVAYKVIGWVFKVKTLRDFAAKVLSGKISKEKLMGELEKVRSLSSLGAKIKLLDQLERKDWGRVGDVSEAPNAIRYDNGVGVPQPSVSVSIDGKNHWLRGSGDLNDHITAITIMLQGDAPDSKMQFEIRSKATGETRYFINKKGDKEYRPLMRFATLPEARAALKDQYAEVVAAWENVKGRDNITERDLRSEENRPRAGQDWRKGKDVSAEEFQSTFGFRGGEFGKWVSQGKGAQERQFFLNSAYDALMDLSNIIGVPPKAISLDGTLGIAFGSRGSGWASAHFEPSNLVISLTKPRGAGALAHEWFHAMDNYFARKRGGEVPFSGDNNAYRNNNYITHKTTPMMVRKNSPGSSRVTKERLAEWRKGNSGQGDLSPENWMEDPNHKAGVRAEVEERFENLVRELDKSPMLQRARTLEGSKDGDGYWSRTIERAARSFENYVQTRMMEQGYHNDFLANVKAAPEVGKNEGRYPYLLPSEIAPVADAFASLFSTIQTKDNPDGSVAMFSRRTGSGNRVPDVVIGHRLGDLNRHPDYEAAKSGDSKAAARIAADLVDEAFVQRVREAAGNADLIVPVVSVEAAGRNKIPAAVADILAEKLGSNTDAEIIQANSPKRTGMDGLDRLLSPPVFVGPVQAGAAYVLVDDTVTQGGTFASLASHIRDSGGRVAGLVALTGKQYSARLSPSPELLGQVRERFSDIETSFRAATGYGFDALTESEARYLVKHDDAQRVRDRVIAAGDQAGNEGDAGIPPRNSRGKAASSGLTSSPAFSPAARAQAVKSVEDMIGRISQRWANAPEVIVAFDMQDARIPERVRQEDLKQRTGGATGTPEGFFYQGKVYLMASKLTTPGDVARVLFHEALGHAGLRGVFGDALKPILRQIVALRRGEVNAKIKEYGLRGVSDLDLLTAAEEVLAEMAQTRPEMGFVKRAIAAIRAFLRKNVPGFADMKLTDADIIQQYILPARAFVERGKGSVSSGDLRLAFSFAGERATTADTQNLTAAQSRLNDQAGPQRFATEQEAIDAGFTLKAYRGVSKANPFNDTESTWLTTSRSVAEAYAEEVMGYDDPDVLTVMVNPSDLKRHDASQLTEEQREEMGADEFGNPQAVGIYDRSDDHPLGGSAGNVTVIHAPKSAAAVIASANPDIRFSRTSPADGAGDGQIEQFSLLGKSANVLKNYRGLGLQALGRRQLVDLYNQELPQLLTYNNLVQAMDAEKNNTGADADRVATEWGKLDKTTGKPGEEQRLSEIMHDATLARMDPAKEYDPTDNRIQYKALKAKYDQLAPESKALYIEARDMYVKHYDQVQQSIKDRIERSDMGASQKAKMIARMNTDFFKKTKGVYFPLARFGKYVMVVKNANGEVVNASRAETLNEAETTRRELLRLFTPANGFTVGKVTLQAEFNPGRDAVGRGFMADLFTVLDKSGVDDALRDSVSQLYLSSLPDLSWAKHGIHRKGTPGFSQDARRAFAQNMFHGARYLAKLRYSDKLQSQLTQMQENVDAYRGVDEYDSVKAQQVVDEMVKRHETLMNPQTNSLSTALTSVGFVFFLGISPAAAMVNLSQTALVAYPIMGAKWGFGKASAALLKASAETVRAKNDLSQVLTGAELEAFNQAVADGTIDVTMAHDLAGISQGEDQRVVWALRPVMRAASFLFHHAERFNRQATFVASYRLSRDTGASNQVAFEEAKKATYDGHFDYAGSNRPRVMQGNVARVVLLFKQYGQNMIYTLARQAVLSTKSLPSKERTEARKALSGILAAHAAAAGVLGLPIVGALLGAASMLGSDDDEPWDAEVALQNSMADALGPKAAEVIARGLSRLTPWDISSRVALNRLILPDVQEGLEGQRWAEAYTTAALGPVLGIGVGVAKGLNDMADGKYQRGFESMLPVFLRNLVKSERFNDEGALDRTGIVIKDEVSLAGVLGQASGFAPSEVRRATEGRQAIYSHDKARMERRRVLMNQFAEARMAGDSDGLQDAREAINRFNQKNPARRITPLQLLQSQRARQRRLDQADQGVYLPKNRRDSSEAGRFATTE
jgi:orotate phosphoribosyltransferase